MIKSLPTILTEGSFTAGAAAAWYDSIAYASADTTINQANNGQALYTAVASVGGGTADKLRIGLGPIDFDGTGFKIALYDSAGTTLVGSITSSIGTADSNTLKEFTFSSAPTISAADYIVAWEPNSGGFTDNDWAAKSGTTATHAFSPSYSSFPPSTISGTFGNFATVSVGIHVTP